VEFQKIVVVDFTDGRAMIINAKVSRENPRGYALWSEGWEVGWLRSGIVGFCRLPAAVGVRHAAEVAADTLAEWYRVRWQQSAPVAWAGPVAPELQVTVNGLVVGRLFKSLERPALGDAGGFELRIPHNIWIATGVELAQRIYTALHHATPVTALHHAPPVTAPHHAGPATALHHAAPVIELAMAPVAMKRKVT
jgi:hypothetical protein